MSRYFEENFKSISPNGLTPELQQLAEDDSKVFEVAQLENDKQRNLFMTLDNFVDELLEEFDAKEHDKKVILIEVFNELKEKEDVDLLDIRKAVFKSIKKLSLNKVAYPNTVGVQYSNVKQKHDVDKWMSALEQIYSGMYKGEDRENASKKVMEGWSPMEKYDFENWSRFYENDDHNKYTVKTAAPLFPQEEKPNPVIGNNFPTQNKFKPEPVEKMPMPEIPMELLDQKGRPGRPKGTGLPKTTDEQKKDLIKKLTDAQKILQEFVKVWPEQTWRMLDEALGDLRRQILVLKTASTQKDCIYRTASVWDRIGFSEGADVLIKIAEGVTDEIANALEGKKEKAPEAAPSPAEMPMDPGMELAPPPAEEAPPEMPPAGAAEELPLPAPPPAPEEEMEPEPVPEESKKKDPLVPESDVKLSAESENPYIGKTIQDVVAVLEPTAQQLSERRVVRELTKADMMLDALNIASHFPELGEAIAKMIESTLYVHTRLEKVISKLKGGLNERETNGTKDEEPPVIEMQELEKPAEQAPNEKEMFEVTEEEPEGPGKI